MTVTGLGVPTVPTRGGRPTGAPAAGPLVDTYGRIATDLRVSLTDRCNLRCAYCMPAEGLDWLPGEQVLRPDELARLLGIAVRRLGVSSVRFTGGEPLLARHLEETVAAAAALRPRPEISMTTNGVGLARRAAALARAGLNRVNVSLDSVDRKHFATITRRDRLNDVLAGLRAAKAAGLQPVKVNAVLDPRTGRRDVVDLLRFCLEHGYQLRVIEQMPLDAGHQWRRDAALSAKDVLAALQPHFRLRPDPAPARIGTRPVVVGRGRFDHGPHELRADRVGLASVLLGLRPHPPDGRRPGPKLPVRRTRNGPAGPAARRCARRGNRGGLAHRDVEQAGRPRYQRPAVRPA